MRGKVAALVYKTVIKGRGDPSRSPRDIPQFTKVGTKIRRPVAVSQSVTFACGPKAKGLFCRFLQGGRMNEVKKDLDQILNQAPLEKSREPYCNVYLIGGIVTARSEHDMNTALYYVRFEVLRR
jgi:hypothetical protein